MELQLQQPWRIFDQSLTMQQRSPLESFATDDTLCHVVGQGQSIQAVRTWVHDDAVVLGIQDHRLPFIEEGMDYLKSVGFNPIVRNSGGLAVVLDRGVLNISLIFSEQQTKISIHDGFEQMVTFIRLLLPEVAEKIEAYEVVGSYCPGTYDLSICGQKFAGISQRRMKNGIAVQIYVCVEGSGAERAEMIRQFYDVALKDVETKFTYPKVNPSVMASLQELVSPILTVHELNVRIQQLFPQSQLSVFDIDEQQLYEYYLQRIFDRNSQMLKTQ